MPTRRTRKFASDQKDIDARPRRSDEARSTQRVDPRPLLPNMSEAGGGQAPRHRALPCAIRLTTERRQDCIGPSDRAASASFACLAARPSGRTHSLFTMSNNWLARGRATLSLKGERCASRQSRWRILMVRTGSMSRGDGTWCAPPSRSRHRQGRWWSKTGSNRRPHACKARALPTELLPRTGGREGQDARMIGGPGKTRTSDLTLIKRAL